MAATENFQAPSWNNSIDDDLDDIRDTANFLLGQALLGADCAPGWRTVVGIATNNNYAEPDTITHTKTNATSGKTRKFTVNLTWQ